MMLIARYERYISVILNVGASPFALLSWRIKMKALAADLVRVVIADDHEAALSALTRILSHEFNVVGTAKNGKEAVEATTLLKPDVVILDIQMPIMNGFEAARTILSSESAARIIFITAVADSDYVRVALGLGASGYVVKSRAALDLPHAIRLAMLGQSFVSPV